MKFRKPLIAAALVAAVAVPALSACDPIAKHTEQFKDAQRGATNSGPADTGTMPDGFSNYATKCDHGNRVYVLFHSNSAYGSIAVVPNESDCASTK